MLVVYLAPFIYQQKYVPVTLYTYHIQITSMKLFYSSVISSLLLLCFCPVHAQLDNAGLPSTTVSDAYSTRKLSSTYSGFCLRVRRSSDNAEGNVAFDAGTSSVTSSSIVTVAAAGSSGLSVGSTLSFASFYAANSCFVTTWYDQTGNGRDATQSTASAQPSIVNAGVIDLLNGHPAITFQNTGQEMTYLGSMTVQTINGVRSAPNTNWQTLVAMPANADFSLRAISGNMYYLTPNSNDWYASTGSPNQFWVNGAQSPSFSSTAAHTITANSNAAVTGSMSISTTFMTRGMSGGAAISEIILFPASLSTADRHTLELNQSAFFSTPSTLPLNLISFTGTQNNNVNHLQWQTTGEINTRQFIIERKINDENFTAIGQVPANGKGSGNYAYADNVFAAGKVYYRLKMVDIDEQFTYSNTVTLSSDDQNTAARIYPNPVGNTINLQIRDKQLLNTKARLVDINGSLIYSFMINNWQQTIDISNQPRGSYLLQLGNGDVLKVIKN